MIDNKLAILSKQKTYITQCNSIPIKERIEILKRLRELIRKNQDNIKQALFEDLHKNHAEAYMTEIGITLSEISYCIKHIKHIFNWFNNTTMHTNSIFTNSHFNRNFLYFITRK